MLRTSYRCWISEKHAVCARVGDQLANNLIQEIKRKSVSKLKQNVGVLRGFHTQVAVMALIHKFFKETRLQELFVTEDTIETESLEMNASSKHHNLDSCMLKLLSPAHNFENKLQNLCNLEC